MKNANKIQGVDEGLQKYICPEWLEHVLQMLQVYNRALGTLASFRLHK